MDVSPDNSLVCSPAEAMERASATAWRVRAPAKLNLTLRVGPLRADGYHPLDSIVAKVTLYDELLIERAPDGVLELVCPDPQAGPAEGNLALRAARALRQRGGRGGARITLHKRIGVGAGLGGGSSDAARTLWALNQIWGLNLPPAELAALGASLGSDVPLFLGPPASRMRGRGEVLDPIDLPAFDALLVTPPVHCATGPVYLAFDAQNPGPLVAFDPARLTGHPVSQWDDRLVNDLYAPARQACPAVGDWADRLHERLGRPVHMTGSGSALFVLLADRQDGLALHAQLPPDLARCARLVGLNPW